VSVAVQNGAYLEQLNLGQARIESLTAIAAAQIAPVVCIKDSLAYTHSRVDMTTSPFPYVPNVVNILGAEVVPIPKASFTANLRSQTSEYVSSTAGSLAGVAFVDLQARGECDWSPSHSFTGLSCKRKSLCRLFDRAAVKRQKGVRHLFACRGVRIPGG
jgi:hypothetical protein